MKIKSITPFAVDGGFRPWVFVKIVTDEGLVGWGDCTDWDAPYATCKAVEYLEKKLIGEDPMNVEKIWWRNTQIFQRMWGGIAWKAMSGIDTALLDIKGKALGVPVYQLLGGKIRDTLRLYWTHCASSRAFYADKVQKKPLHSLNDLREFCAEIKENGFTALKTNIIPLEGTALYGKPTDLRSGKVWNGLIEPETIRTAVSMMEVFRKELGSDFGLALDTALCYRGRGALELARALEPFHMMWLETETFDPDAQAQLHNSTTTPIVHGESIYDMQGYLPFLMRHAQSGLMIDLSWNGLTLGKKIADLALAFDCTVSPHNCHSPLTSYIAMHYCAAVKNFSILEFDFDDVPWRDEIVTDPVPVKNGFMEVVDRPGLGTELIESALLKYRVQE